MNNATATAPLFNLTFTPKSSFIAAVKECKDLAGLLAIRCFVLESGNEEALEEIGSDRLAWLFSKIRIYREIARTMGAAEGTPEEQEEAEGFTQNSQTAYYERAARLAGCKVATFAAIYSDYAKADAQAYVSTFGGAMEVVNISAVMNAPDNDGFSDWTATVYYRERTPAQAYAAKHNGSLRGYKPAKDTRRQARNAARRIVHEARSEAAGAAWAERTARIQYSQAAGEACQDLRLPTYGDFVQVYVKGAAVFKSMVSMGWPPRKVVAELLQRAAGPCPLTYRFPKEYRRAQTVAARYFAQFRPKGRQ